MYAYLNWCIMLGLVWIAFYFHRKDLHYEMIFSSLLFLPFGFTQPLFVPEYWNPVVIHQFFGLFDIESLLWCFFTGGIAAVIYEEVLNYHLRKSKLTFKQRHNLKKKTIGKYRHHAYITYGLLFLMAFVIIYVKYFTAYSVLHVSFLVALIAIFYLILSRPDLTRESFIGGFCFMLFYIISLLFINFTFPGFVANEWNFQGTFGIYFFNIPLDEYIYALLFGMAWSIVYEEVKNLKLRKELSR